MRLNGRAAPASARVREGDVVEYEMTRVDGDGGSPRGEDIPLRVVYEDDDLLVVDKPAGMVVHPALGHGSGTLVNALLGRSTKWSRTGGAKRPGIVHRLDKGTSGLLVVAKTDAAHRALAAQLADRTLSRTYLAIVKGSVEHAGGVLEGDIARDRSNRQRMAVVEKGRFARTRYAVVERLRGATLLRCDLETGRTHQIRVHLAAFGHPVLGDETYGRHRGGEPPRPMLHAWRLKFRHPSSGQEVQVEAPLPADFEGQLESLR